MKLRFSFIWTLFLNCCCVPDCLLLDLEIVSEVSGIECQPHKSKLLAAATRLGTASADDLFGLSECEGKLALFCRQLLLLTAAGVRGGFFRFLAKRDARGTGFCRREELRVGMNFQVRAS